MKKLVLLVFGGLLLTFSACEMEADRNSDGKPESEHGPNGDRQAAETTTVSNVLTSPHSGRITLRGSIVRQVKGEYFLFGDHTGEILVEIEGKVWRAAALRWRDLNPGDTVEIRGKLEREKSGVKMEVHAIRRMLSSNGPSEPEKPGEPEEPSEPGEPGEPEEPGKPNGPATGYVIKFELNGGIPAPNVDYSDQIVPPGEKMTMPQPPLREGYVFHAWEEVTDNFTLEAGFSIEAWRDKVSRANWFSVYRVRFFDVYGKVIETLEIVEGMKGAFVPKPEYESTLPGYEVFFGWRKGAAGVPAIPDSDWPVPITEHTDFYPVYGR